MVMVLLEDLRGEFVRGVSGASSLFYSVLKYQIVLDAF